MLTLLLRCSNTPLNPLHTIMSRIRVTQVGTRKATFTSVVMTNSDKTASFVNETNRHVGGGEQRTKTFPMEVATAQEARNACRTDALMGILQ